jgi:hypothetical protein
MSEWVSFETTAHTSTNHREARDGRDGILSDVMTQFI